MAYEVIQRIEVKSGDRVRYKASGTELVVERYVPDPPKPGEIDVTAECFTELRESKTSGGHYVAIIHDGKVRFALGVDEKSKIIPFQAGRYHIERVLGATVSFKVTKRV